MKTTNPFFFFVSFFGVLYIFVQQISSLRARVRQALRSPRLVSCIVSFLYVFGREYRGLNHCCVDFFFFRYQISMKMTSFLTRAQTLKMELCDSTINGTPPIRCVAPT